MVRLFTLLVILGLAVSSSFADSHETTQGEASDVPLPMREFRAAWVATVANIDWPSRPGLSVEDQKAEALNILDITEDLNMNALVFQIRPHADAFYQSDLEPWSYYLTGVQGKAPDPFYDPLEFWVEESHKRGIELHVWLNPYRAHHPSMRNAPMAENSIVKTRPDLALKIGDSGYYWLDPANPDTQQHSLDVVMDVVNRYDIDGVHFDDYFYPYPSYNGGAGFPDDASWAAYQESGGELSRDDWRRHAVDSFIERLYSEIKAAKPHVKFGISPFGIWKPGNPENIQGFNQYEELFADAKLWLNEGWVDYYTPQLYWPTGQIPQSFPLLLKWWVDQNWKKRNIWPGLGLYKYVRNEEETREVVDQVMITRAIADPNPGHVYFSFKQLERNASGIQEVLKNSVYGQKALVPTSPWLDDQAPAAPTMKLSATEETISVEWAPADADDSFLTIVSHKVGSRWSHEILPHQVSDFEITVPKDRVETVTSNQGLDSTEVTVEADPITAIAVRTVDRMGNVSKAAYKSF